MHDAKDKLSIFDLPTGSHIEDIDVGIGCVEVLSGRREQNEFFFKVVSFLNPGIIYRYDLTKSLLKEYRKTKVEGLSSEKLEVKQVFVESKDKTKIPAFIIKPKVRLIHSYKEFLRTSNLLVLITRFLIRILNLTKIILHYYMVTGDLILALRLCLVQVG